ncbi:MAG: hypothetical protein M1376_12360 [Planctomycetes bacterium]|nr:hypothetical protein [Planctomycetota bacterium]
MSLYVLSGMGISLLAVGCLGAGAGLGGLAALYDFRRIGPAKVMKLAEYAESLRTCDAEAVISSLEVEAYVEIAEFLRNKEEKGAESLTKYELQALQKFKSYRDRYSSLSGPEAAMVFTTVIWGGFLFPPLLVVLCIAVCFPQESGRRSGDVLLISIRSGGPGEGGFLAGVGALPEIQVDQILVGNTGLLGQGLTKKRLTASLRTSTSRLPCHAIGPKRKMPGVWGQSPQGSRLRGRDRNVDGFHLAQRG